MFFYEFRLLLGSMLEGHVLSRTFRRILSSPRASLFGLLGGQGGNPGTKTGVSGREAWSRAMRLEIVPVAFVFEKCWIAPAAWLQNPESPGHD